MNLEFVIGLLEKEGKLCREYCDLAMKEASLTNRLEQGHPTYFSHRDEFMPGYTSGCISFMRYLSQESYAVVYLQEQEWYGQGEMQSFPTPWDEEYRFMIAERTGYCIYEDQLFLANDASDKLVTVDCNKNRNIDPFTRDYLGRRIIDMKLSVEECIVTVNYTIEEKDVEKSRNTIIIAKKEFQKRYDGSEELHTP